jgi:maltose alpha-D-glucosyltransferase/alpha-amylase
MNPDTATNTFDVRWEDCFTHEGFKIKLFEEILPGYLNRCRWFAGKSESIKQFDLDEFLVIETSIGPAHICILEIINSKGNAETYLVPLSFVTESAKNTVEDPEKSYICDISFHGQSGCLIESTSVEPFRRAIFESLNDSAKIPQPNGQLVFHKGRALKKDSDKNTYRSSRILGAEQSNTTVVYNDEYFLKFYRRLFINPNPDYELSRFLSETAGFKNTPKYAGSLNWRKGKLTEITLALGQKRVDNDGDVWEKMLEWVNVYFHNLEKGVDLHQDVEKMELYEPVPIADVPSIIKKMASEKVLELIALLGVRTAEMHIALASDKNNRAFWPEQYNEDFSVWVKNRLVNQFNYRFTLVENNFHRLTGKAIEYANEFLDRKNEIKERIVALDVLKLNSQRIRIHGDFHLGQVLISADDFYILDFEGEPESTIRDRKVKQSPLKDVSGMLRSFHYAIYAVIFNEGEKFTYDQQDMFDLGEKYYRAIAAVYLNSYIQTAMENALDIGYRPEIDYLLKYHLLEKAIYEIGYELNSRPSWAIIPLKGIMQILNNE